MHHLMRTGAPSRGPTTTASATRDRNLYRSLHRSYVSVQRPEITLAVAADTIAAITLRAVSRRPSAAAVAVAIEVAAEAARPAPAIARAVAVVATAIAAEAAATTVAEAAGAVEVDPLAAPVKVPAGAKQGSHDSSLKARSPFIGGCGPLFSSAMF